MAGDPTALALTPGAVFHGRYEIVRCIATGGMGAVYEVVDQRTRRRRALKVMLPGVVGDPDLRARFKQEATVTAEIESEHIVETFDADVDPETGAPFLAMELLKGHDLGAELAQRGSLPPSEVVALLRQATLALERTHAAGVVHRDLKPENLFLTASDDGAPRLKVLDFGIAKIVARSSELAKTTRAMGSPLYMSPEQVEGDGSIGPRADLYALAHIAYALLAGDAYWNDDSPTLHRLFLNIMRGPEEAPSARAGRRGVTLPPAFDAWFARAAAVDPAARLASASELLQGLADALDVALPRPSLPSAPARAAGALAPGGAPMSSPTPVVSSRPGAIPGVRSRVSWVLGAVLLLFAGGGAAALGLRAKPLEPSAAASVAPPIASAAVVVVASVPVASPPDETTPAPPASARALPVPQARKPQPAPSAAQPPKLPPARAPTPQPTPPERLPATETR